MKQNPKQSTNKLCFSKTTSLHVLLPGPNGNILHGGPGCLNKEINFSKN